MSSFFDVARNPKTNRTERAAFIDDYFGKHQYGVFFEDNPKAYRPDDVSIQRNDIGKAMKKFCINCKYHKIEQQEYRYKDGFKMYDVDMCHHESSRDIVTGKTGKMCALMRSFNSEECGPKGSLWEEREDLKP